MRAAIISFIFLLQAPFALATAGDAVKLSGYVLSFDEKNLTLESGQSKIKLPRRLYPQPVTTGHKITVELTEADMKDVSATPLAPKTSK